MRNPLLLGALATVIAIAALAISIVALLAPAADSTDDDDVDFRLADRGEFTVDMVLEAIERYDAEGRDATVSYYNTPESLNGEWYVFIFDEADKLIAHADPDLLGHGPQGRSWRGLHRLPLRRRHADRGQTRSLGGLPVPQSPDGEPGIQALMGHPPRRSPLRLRLVPDIAPAVSVDTSVGGHQDS